MTTMCEIGVLPDIPRILDKNEGPPGTAEDEPPLLHAVAPKAIAPRATIKAKFFTRGVLLSEIFSEEESLRQKMRLIIVRRRGCRVSKRRKLAQRINQGQRFPHVTS